MSFYNDWNNCLLKGDDDCDYLEAFLKKKDYTIRVLKDGTNEQIELFCNVLLSYSIDSIIDFLDDKFYSELEPSEIVQFSNFENGTITLSQLLYNKSEGMTYLEIGRAMVGNVANGAAIKYGENHSKLGRDFDLVTIDNYKPAVVHITNFGKCFAFFDKKDQMKLMRILTLRNLVVQNLIIKAKKGLVSYSDECNCLSESTKIRRRSNVKKLVELVFNNKNNSIINNIIW